MTDWYRLTPSYWFQNYPTDPDWDEFVSMAIDTGDITEITHHTCKVGGIKTWISNWPYAYGHPYEGGFTEILPYVATRKRLRRSIQNLQKRSLMERIGRHK